jgi:membrane-associated phospholipid phosphatase
MRFDWTRIRTYVLWSSAAGGVFFALYPAINWLTTMRTDTYRLYFDWELGVPLVPRCVWAYLSMYALFLAPPLFMEPPALRALGKQLIWATLVCGAMFLVLPATLGFERVVPDDPAVAGIYQTMFALDPPHNLVPSLHVVWSAAIALAVRDSAAVWGRWFFAAWLACIAVSTLLVHQHHIADVVVALALVAVIRKTLGGTKSCSSTVWLS